jgi:hypothetical protein
MGQCGLRRPLQPHPLGHVRGVVTNPSERRRAASVLPRQSEERSKLTPGEDVIDKATWAGAIPQVNGVAPRVRVGRDRWFNLLWLLPIGFLLLIIAVAVAKGLRTEPSVQHFIARYPGTLAPSHPDTSSGFPVWLRLQHFFNLFLLIFIIRAGVQILSDHPRLYWTRHSTPGREWFRIQNPVPAEALWSQAGLDQPPDADRSAGASSLDRPGALVAPRRRRALAAQRCGLLCPAVCKRSLAAPCPDELGSLPERRLGADPVLLPELAARQRLGRLQQPAAARLLHYRLRRRPARPVTGLGMSPAPSTRFK